jgi:hypothetical protein
MTHISAIIFIITICFGCSPAVDDNRAAAKTGVAEETLVVAKRHGLDYVATLAKAKAGDAQAVRTMIDFSDHVDAASSLGHGVELVDLAVALTDERFAGMVRDEPEIRRQTVARLFEAGFAYHLHYSHGDFSKLLPATYAALNAR